jgi:hypothetical protein
MIFNTIAIAKRNNSKPALNMPSIINKHRDIFILSYLIPVIAITFVSCGQIPDDVQNALNKAGSNRSELQKVIDFYKHKGDDQKLKAAYFLLAGLPGQFHHEGRKIDAFRQQFRKMDTIIRSGELVRYNQVWDSLQKSVMINESPDKVYDIDVIKGQFLIDNIEDSYQSWQLPWAKHLSFDDFCQYLLPYKIVNEQPLRWRPFFRKKYQWVIDSAKSNPNPIKVANLINNDLKKWFNHINVDLPFDLSYEDLMGIKSGKCPQEIELAAYAMRSLGLPVVLDGVPLWANRSFRHDWNALVVQGQSFPFLGTEGNIGQYKIETARPNAIESRRAKVYRTTYMTQPLSLGALAPEGEDIPALFNNTRFIDVTNIYVPVSDVTIPLNKKAGSYSHIYLCVFNNLKWQPVDWAPNHNHEKVTFKNIGRNIAYLPMVMEETSLVPAGNAFTLGMQGKIEFLTPNVNLVKNAIFDRKYPDNNGSNKVIVGNHYELFYWNGQWVSLGKSTATRNTIQYNHIPDNALLWLRCLDKGFQERIFTIKHTNVRWW